MADLDKDYERFMALTERQAAGERLSAEELSFCERMQAEHPSCAREMELLDELAHLDVAPSAESRALVDAALARLATENEAIEGNEIAQLKRPRVPRFLWLSSLAAAAAMGLTFLLLPPKPTVQQSSAAQVPVGDARVELVYASGEVLVDDRKVRGSLRLLDEGSAIRVGRGSACFAMDPGIDICAAEHTELRLSRTRGKWRRIDLDKGRLAVQLLPQPQGSQLSIVADGVWSTAVGTAFTVERDAALGVRTSVLHGKVRVGSDGGQEQLVGAHQQSEVQGGATRVTATSRNDESPQWALLGPAKLWSNPVSATLELRGLPQGAELWLDGQRVGVAPLSSLIPAGHHALEVRIAEQLVARREFVSEVGQPSVLSFESIAAATLPVAAQPTTRSPIATERPLQHAKAPAIAATPAMMLGEARRLMREARFREAASAYDAVRVAYPESPEAQAVLMSLAELQVDRLGQPSAALANVERYLRGEHGALAVEALAVRIRALRALGQPARERAAISDFLQRYPQSFQATALAQRLLDLKQTR